MLRMFLQIVFVLLEFGGLLLLVFFLWVMFTDGFSIGQPIQNQLVDSLIDPTDKTLHGDDYSIYNGQTIELRNVYHPKNKVLRFLLQNASPIVKIELQDRKLWCWKFENSSDRVTFYRKDLKLLDVSEYHFRWSAEQIKSDSVREIWVYHGSPETYWFSTYQSCSANWPMSRTARLPSIPFNSVQISIQHTNEPIYIPQSVTEHIFVNTDGFGLILPCQSPLFLRFEPNQGDPALVISVQNKLPYLVDTASTHYPGLRFNVVTGADVRRLYDAISSTSMYIQRPTNIPDERLFTYPICVYSPNQWVYRKKDFNQRSIQKFSRELKRVGFENSLILLDGGWEHETNFMAINKKLLPDPQRLLRKLHRQGFRVGLSVDPNVKFNCTNFLIRKYFVKNESGNAMVFDDRRLLPDFSDAESVRWFHGRFEKLFSQSTLTLNCATKPSRIHRFDVFQFLPLKAFSSHFQLADQAAQSYPNLYVQKYLETLSTVENLAGNDIIYYDAFQSQQLGGLVRIADRPTGDWWGESGLKSLIPTVLTLSIAGYSFVLCDAVHRRFGQISRELYIRWAQATTLMPTMLFTIPPWDFEEDESESSESVDLVELIRQLVTLHTFHSGTIRMLAHRRMVHGQPMVRPLWYCAPTDPFTYAIDDQFMLGDNIVVAPVLQEGQRQRRVYLPEGNWQDHTGTHHIGSKWIEVQAPLHVLPYFQKTTQDKE